MSGGPTARDSVLISADALYQALGREDLVVLDVRHRPRDEGDLDGYLDGHVPGALWASVPQHFAGPYAGAARLPLPELPALQSIAREWGITEDTEVVVYGAENIAGAARAWLVLTWAGVARVRMLDGGLRAWTDSDLPLEQGPREAPGGGTIELRGGGFPILEAEDAARVGGRGRLIDGRGRDAFTGAGLDPHEARRAEQGHIPGARSLPAADLLDDALRLLPQDRLVALLGPDADADSAGAYCGGGVAASLLALAAASTGRVLPVYIGSFSDWVSDPSRPVTTELRDARSPGSDR